MRDSIQKYGWIVIVVIIISILIGIAAPAANFLKNNFVHVVEDFGNKIDGNYSDNGGSGNDDEDIEGDEEEYYPAGLYETGSNYTVLLKSWEELLSSGIVHVTDGVVYTNYDDNAWENHSSYALAGDLVLPNDGSIKVIGASAFDSCYNLTGLIVPNSITTIEYYAFYDCTELKGNIYDGAVYLGNPNNPYLVLLMAENEYITSCNVNEKTKFIYEGAFSGCENLSNITIPNSVKDIGAAAFEGCASLISVDLPDDLTQIRLCMFSGCADLESVQIPNKITIIGEEAFEDCTSLTNIEIPDSVTEIEWQAFNGCSGLTTVVIPGSVINIGDEVFIGCSNLTTVTIANGVENIGIHAFYECDKLANVTIGNTVTKIGSFAFGYCPELTNIKFEGTMDQWNDISFEGGWIAGSPASQVVCSDGNVSLD